MQRGALQCSDFHSEDRSNLPSTQLVWQPFYIAAQHVDCRFVKNNRNESDFKKAGREVRLGGLNEGVFEGPRTARLLPRGASAGLFPCNQHVPLIKAQGVVPIQREADHIANGKIELRIRLSHLKQLFAPGQPDMHDSCVTQIFDQLHLSRHALLCGH